MFYRWIVIIYAIISLAFLISCSNESASSPQSYKSDSYPDVSYSYTVSELEVLDLINNYRIANGLNILEKIDYVSIKSEEHNNYMIITNSVTHNGFVSRSEDIIKVLGAQKIAENIAYNYRSPKGVFDAWIKSPEHKKNIIGDFTNFGISIRQNTDKSKIYYTNIFVKK